MNKPFSSSDIKQLNLIDAKEYIENASKEPIRWLVSDMIPRGELTLLTGNAKVGKSLFTLYVASCLAHGRKVLGRNLAERDSMGFMLFLNLEDGKVVIGDRLKTMQSDAQFPPSRLYFIDPMEFRGRVTKYLRSLPPTQGDYEQNDRGTQEWRICRGIEQSVKVFEEALKGKTNECLMIVIDPAIEFLGVSDENAATQVATALAPLRVFAQTHGIAVILVHHNNKQGKFRGSTAFEGSPNTLIRMTEKYIQITSKSSLLSGEQQKIWYQRKEGLSFELQTGEQNSLAIRKGKEGEALANRKKNLQSINQKLSQGMEISWDEITHKIPESSVYKYLKDTEDHKRRINGKKEGNKIVPL